MITIVIVTYHNEDTIEACLASIRDMAATPYEVIVVDNSNNDETAAKVETYQSQYPDFPLHLVCPGENLGFGRGCNRGASEAKGDFLFFLNPDTRFENDAAGILRGFMEKTPGAEIAGPMVLDDFGEITKTCRNLPTWPRILMDATGLDKHLGVYRLLRFDHRQPRRVDQVIGAGFFMRRETFERLEGFDPRFFMYFEEVDLCKRVLDSGGEIWFRPEAKIRHLAGVSTENVGAAARMIQVFRQSRQKYFEKHFSTLNLAILKTINRLEGLGKWAVFTVLYLLFRKPIHLEKAKGFCRVAI